MQHSRIFIAMMFMCLACPDARTQTSLPLKAGKIRFERRINMSARVGKEGFMTTPFTLIFSPDRSLYFYDNAGSGNTGGDIPTMPAGANVVYTDLDHRTFVSQKKVFDRLFLVKDSIRKITWKLTGEKRVIAGFECRRANAMIMDSVYVVAFYTNDIAPSGGPESFSGLPGMILGVALPHEHITWWATSVSSALPDGLKPPDNGAGVSARQLEGQCREMFKNIHITDERPEKLLTLILL